MGGSQPAHCPRRTAKPGVETFPRPPGSAGRSRRLRRWRRKRPAKLRGRRYVAHGTGTRTAAMGQGRRTATTERAPAPMAAPGSANTRRARGAGRPRTGNSGNGYPPTSPVFFFFGRGLHKPVAFVARAGLPPCVLANLGRKRGQGSGTTTPDHGNTGARGWDLSTVTRSGSGHSGVRKRQPHSRRFRRPPQHRQRS